MLDGEDIGEHGDKLYMMGGGLDEEEERHSTVSMPSVTTVREAHMTRMMLPSVAGST